MDLDRCSQPKLVFSHYVSDKNGLNAPPNGPK